MTCVIVPNVQTMHEDFSLADMIDVGVDQDGRLGVAFSDNNSRFAAPLPGQALKQRPFDHFAKQASGPALFTGASLPPVASSSHGADPFGHHPVSQIAGKSHLLDRNRGRKHADVDPFAGDARVHELGSGRAEDDFAMEGGVVGMRVGYESAFLRKMRVEPPLDLRQPDTRAKLDLPGHQAAKL